MSVLCQRKESRRQSLRVLQLNPFDPQPALMMSMVVSPYYGLAPGRLRLLVFPLLGVYPHSEYYLVNLMILQR